MAGTARGTAETKEAACLAVEREHDELKARIAAAKAKAAGKL